MRRLSIAGRMMLVFGLIAVTQVGIAAVGLNGFRLSNADLETVYQNRLVPVSQLSRINDLMHTNIEQLTIAVIARPSAKNVQRYIDKVEANLTEIEALAVRFSKQVGDEDKKLVADWSSKRTALAEKGIKPAIASLKAQAFNDAEDTVLGVAIKQFEAAQEAFERIVAGELKRAELTNLAAGERYQFIKTLTIGVVSLALAFCALMAFYVRQAITGPLAKITFAMKSLAGGNEAVEIRYADRADEIGETARAAQGFKDSLLRIDVMEAERHEADRRTTAERKAGMHRLADEFQASVGGVINAVSSASAQLESAANTLTKNAEVTQELSGSVAAASEQASANVQSVASATEEMNSSVNEISRQVHESARIAGDAVRQAHETDVRINALSHAASRIGDVVKLITAIAEQTNLLALNATIEAARAGDAGRGFAVVASEVKQLAAQTAKATDEIGTQIAGMQTATQQSVGAIKEIGGTIGRIAEIASTIAAAVEEQGAATQEIARNVGEASQGTSEVAAKITDVNRGASETGSASAQVLSSAQSLSSESNRLRLAVEEFLSTVRAA